MTVDIHVSRSKNLILNGSRYIDVNTKYKHQQTNNLDKIHYNFYGQEITLKSCNVHRIYLRQV